LPAELLAVMASDVDAAQMTVLDLQGVFPLPSLNAMQLSLRNSEPLQTYLSL
jgi:hypothetical protein